MMIQNLRQRARKGFTLIELMIVVAIIGILAAIAIPNFIRYQLRSKQSEAKANIGGIRTALTSFRGDYDQYPDIAALGGGAGAQKGAFTPAGCAAACNRNAIASCSDYDCIGFNTEGQTYYSYQVVADNTAVPEFVIEAVGDLDADGVNGVWAYYSDDDGDLGAGTVAAAPNCAGIAAAGGVQEVGNCTPSAY